MFAETAPLIAQLDLKGNFTPSLKKASSALSGFASKMDRTGVRFQRAGQQIGTGIRNIGLIAATAVGALATQVAAGLNSLIKLEQATAQTEAVIKSTGGAAGQTADDIARLAEKFEALNATVGDEFVRAGANMLLTFTNITGKGFEPALEAVLNMNTAMGKGPEGLTSTAILVGKALNDPIKGVTALRRVGVQLSKEQEKQIKTLLKQNDLYGAQKIILAELNKEFGGSFAAQGDTTAGKVAKFTDSIEDLQRALAEALLPTLGNVADALTKTLANPQVIQGVRDFGKSLAGLVSPANLATAGKILSNVFAAAKSAAPTIAAAARTMFAVVSAAVKVFQTLPKEIQQLAIGAFAINKLTGGLVTNVAGGILGGIAKGGLFSRGSTPANPLFVTQVGGLPGLPGAAAGAAVGVGGAALVGAGILAASAAISAAAILASPQFARSNQLAAKGLSPAEIEAVKYYQADARYQQEALKHLGRMPSRADFESGLAKLAQGEMFGPPTPNKPTRPAFVDSPRTAPASLADLEAILARGRAAGFKPTFAAAQATNQKNLERLAAAQLAKAEAVRQAIVAGDTRSELAGIRNAVAAAGQKQPVTNVKVEVNVTAAQVAKSVVIQRRYGPSGGSREKGGGANPGI